MSEYSHNPLKTADSPNHGNHLNGLSTREDRIVLRMGFGADSSGR